MAPTTTSTRRRSEKIQKKSEAAKTRIMTRSIYKKEQLLLSQQQQTPKKTAAKNEDKYVESASGFINGNDDHSTNNKDVCTTPKSDKFKIPENTTCPPAPKKPRNNTCFIPKSRQITFFAHPDLEKFFMFATPMRDIKCNNFLYHKMISQVQYKGMGENGQIYEYELVHQAICTTMKHIIASAGSQQIV